jgi:hypothetical protein
LKALFNPGSDLTFLHQRCLPAGATPLISNARGGTTLAGTFTTKRIATMKDILLPEFHWNRKINSQDCLIFDAIFDAECPYDIILGQDFLSKIGMIIDFKDKTLSCFGNTKAMKSKNFYNDPFSALLDMIRTYEDNSDEIEATFQSYHTSPKNITESHYESVDVNEVVKAQKHLSVEQRAKLLNIFSKRTKLFSGKLGHYPHKKMDLELLPGAKPMHQRPYPVPHAHQEVFKKELYRLCEIGVLTRIGATEWAAPTYIIPKKDGHVRWVSNFRELNKLIK